MLSTFKALPEPGKDVQFTPVMNPFLTKRPPWCSCGTARAHMDTLTSIPPVLFPLLQESAATRNLGDTAGLEMHKRKLGMLFFFPSSLGTLKLM